MLVSFPVCSLILFGGANNGQIVAYKYPTQLKYINKTTATNSNRDQRRAERIKCRDLPQ